jgi:hypothetical protein
MGQDIREFWLEVAGQEKIERTADAQRRAKAAETGDATFLEGQDVSGAVFITSEPRRDLSKEWVAGRVALANFNLAARRIVEQSHRRASAGDIAEFRASTKRNYDRCAEEENSRRGISTVKIEAESPIRRKA